MIRIGNFVLLGKKNIGRGREALTMHIPCRSRPNNLLLVCSIDCNLYYKLEHGISVTRAGRQAGEYKLLTIVPLCVPLNKNSGGGLNLIQSTSLTTQTINNFVEKYP